MLKKRELILQKFFKDDFDFLVLGGGATGAGIALDASLRGFKVALVDAQDFSSGASGRSTKLLHGGLRYLELAATRCDWKLLSLVKSSLKERAVLMNIAPHLTKTLSITLPAYGFLEKFYYWAGVKSYEWLSSSQSLGPCRLLSTLDVCNELPLLKKKELRGGVLYLDGQFNDARFNIALVRTAVCQGCIAQNYVEFCDFIKEEGRIVGALVQDKILGISGVIKAKVVVNATGCFSDVIRKKDSLGAAPLLAPSRGTHIVLKENILSANCGFILPARSRGRVVFGLPWEGTTLVGTTDVECGPELNPLPTKEEIEYLLDVLKHYFSVEISKSSISSCWAGIRPLYKGNKAQETALLSRDHYIEKSSSRLYSIVGGKWTTYRLMAKDVVDTVVRDEKLSERLPCRTDGFFLVGAENYSEGSIVKAVKDLGVEEDVARHLARAYGTEALAVARFPGKSRLHAKFPYIEAEVAYALNNEFAVTAEDIIDRRLRIGCQDREAAHFMKRRIDEIISIC